MGGRAVVIGAGITGVSAAEWLRRDGWAVTLLDPRTPGDPGQTSFGNAGLLARAACVPVSVPGLLAKALPMLLDPGAPLYLRWAHLPRLLPWLVPFLRNGRRDRLARIVPALAALTGDTVEAHRALARGTPAEAFLREGDYALLYRDRAAYAADGFAFGIQRGQGFDWEEAEGAALRARLPGLGPATGFAAIFGGHGWVTDPGAHVAALAGHFAARGGTIRRGEAVAVAPGRVTLRGGGELAADRIVLAAGIWSRPLAEALGLRVPMESERGYHLMLRGPSLAPPHPVRVTAGRFVATPMAGGLRLGGIVEFGGLAAPPSRAPGALLRRLARETWPGLAWEAEEVWMGHRPTLADSLPMLGESRRAPGIVMAFGSQHLGLTIGPKLGRLAADLAAGRRPNHDLAPLAPDRFAA